MSLNETDPVIAELIRKEQRRQETTLELIASENHVSAAVMEAAGTVLTNKYAEGYPGARYYGGCEFYDQIENLAIDRAKQLFNCRFANVQPHSGANANLAAFMAMMKPGDSFISLNLASGGHLSHGMKLNASAQFYKPDHYELDPKTETIDFNSVRAKAKEIKPKAILCGYSAYPRVIDFAKFREIADEVGALLMADIAHYAGLIAAGLYPSPVGIADFVTSTTHKTLRGPRGGIILGQAKDERMLNSGIFPVLQGGPLMHVIAAKAVAFKEAMGKDFRAYQQQVLVNAGVMARTLSTRGLRIVSGHTDCHMFLVDLQSKQVTGKDAEAALGRANITVNKNLVPNDPQKAMVTSGVRLGSPAITTRGFKEHETERVAHGIADVVEAPNDERVIARVKAGMLALCRKFPVYG